MRSLLLVESFDFRSSNQYILVRVIPSCFCFAKMFLCQVSLLSRCIPRYLISSFLGSYTLFNKVWHKGLLYKLRSLPLNYFLILNSYLSNRHFIIKVNTELTDLTSVNAGVPQGSVLGPLLYLLYTADLPIPPDSITATFADDTAVVATDCDPATASQKLQASLLAIQSWLKTWRMKANETKSVHVTFTTRRTTCPPVRINDVQIPQESHVKYLGLHLD
jgi:hypothetical protein